ncbi:MAG TPA: hypothetical protein VEJ46_12885 [Candidatus Acidoferrum sp.]|nr:hypothetical protein [Candidatus Acidoferrum sp.]
MKESIQDQVRKANEKLRALISRTRDALGGRGSFDVVNVRAIAEPIRSMQLIVAEAERLRTIHPELDTELKVYAGNLSEMQVVLEQTRFMLIARRAHIEAMRGHLETLGLWSATLRMTR